MRSQWTNKSLENCIEDAAYTTKIQRKDFLQEGKYPVISQEEAFINGYWNEGRDVFRVRTPLVVFGDHTKALKYVDFDFVLGADGVKLLQPVKALEPKFFYYQLQSLVGQIESLGYARHYKLIRELEIAYPDIVEQRRIVAILDKGFESIAIASANAQKNLQNARELLESILDASFKPGPSGWNAKTVGELVDDDVLHKPFDGNHGEIHPVRSDYTDSGVPFVMAADLKNGKVDTSGCRFISRKQADSLRVGFAQDGDVLISHKGTIGRSAILETSYDYVMLTPQVTSYRVKDRTRLLNSFVRFYFMSPTFQREMVAAAEDGSTRAYVGITKQLGLTIAFPTFAKQREIVSSIDALLHESESLESIYQRKLTALDELKQSLLHQAFSGQL